MGHRFDPWSKESTCCRETKPVHWKHWAQGLEPINRTTEPVGFLCGSAGKESVCNAGDLGSISGLGKSPGEGKGYPLQCSGMENSMDCIVHGVAKSQTQLSNFLFHFHAEEELLDHMVVLFWAFWEASILFSSVAALIYIPTNSVQRFTFLHILLIFVICVLFDDSHSDRCEVIARSDFKTVPSLSFHFLSYYPGPSHKHLFPGLL